MSRNRLIKVDFWSDEKLSKVSIEARLAFIGLWTHSDDYGVVKGHPALLCSQIFPYDEQVNAKKFASMMSELETIGVIIPFSENSERYFYITNFLRHQKIDRPSKQRNPCAPADLVDSANIRRALVEHSSSSRRVVVDERERESKRKGERKVQTVGKNDFSALENFESLWTRYPVKDGKKRAKAVYLGYVDTKDRAGEFDRALDNYLEHLSLKQNAWKRAKNGATWFNNWRDWLNWSEPAAESATDAERGDEIGKIFRMNGGGEK